MDQLLPAQVGTAGSSSPPPPSMPDNALSGYSIDELYDFFDFFDASVEDVYAYLLHCTRAPDIAQEITLTVYLTLLRRRRFLFWKNTAKLASALALADKYMASSPRWQQDAVGDAYLPELSLCFPAGMRRETMEGRVRALQRVLRSLPFREQRIAVLQFFLRWPAGRTAALVGAHREVLEREYGAIADTLVQGLSGDPAFQGVNILSELQRLQCPVLSEDRKRAMRHALLERSKAAEGASMRFALPVAIVLLVTGSIASLSLAPTLSAGRAQKLLAAAEVMLLTEELHVRDALADTEQNLLALAATYAERDIAAVTTNLAPYAVSKQLAQKTTVDRLLRGWQAIPPMQTAGRTLKALAASPTLLPNDPGLSFRDISHPRDELLP